MTADSARTQQLADAIDARLTRIHEDLADLARIPSIAWPSHDPAHVAASAQRVAALAEAHGFSEVQILTAPTPTGEQGSPAVIARIPAPEGAPTVLLYAHHDVQPVGDPAIWNTEPFEPTVVGDRMYGRGVADDKAGIMVHLAAVRALADELAVGVTLFAEGEEEAGSPSFAAFLEEHRELLAADAIIVADSQNWAVGTPALTTSLRGMGSVEFTVSTLDHALHSGMFGGAVPDAALAATRMIAGLHDAGGRVDIPELQGVAPAPEVDLDEETFRRDAGVLDGVELLSGDSIARRLWIEPSLTLIGIDLPTVDDSSNTLQGSVRAKISMRVGPGVDVALALEALKRRLTELAPFGAQVEFGPEERGEAFSADVDSPAVQLMLASLADAWGTAGGEAPVCTGIGGSIPFIADLHRVFPRAEILVTGVEDPDSRAHSPNESLHLGDFRLAILAEAVFLDRLGRGGNE